MNGTSEITTIKDKLSSNRPVFVLFGAQATLDQVASALSLYLTLKQQGKEVLIASPAQLRAEFSRLVGLNDIADTIGNKNLVISFGKYDFNSIDKISHNDGTGGQFELVIQPKVGQKAPNPKQIEFSFKGADAELIFLVGVSKLEELGVLYEAERQLFNTASVVSLSRKNNSPVAAITIADETASCLSEVMYDFLNQLGFTPKGDIASNLLAGIDFATNRFQNPMISGKAFIAAGQLINNGARRQPPRPEAMPMAGSMSGRPPFMPFTPPLNGGFMPPMEQPVPPFMPPTANPPMFPMPQPKPQVKPKEQDKPAKTPPQTFIPPMPGTSRV